MRQIIVTLNFIFLSVPVSAHDGSDHTSGLELFVAGFGVAVIVGMGIYTLWWNHHHADELVEYDSFEVHTEQSTKEKQAS